MCLQITVNSQKMQTLIILRAEDLIYIFWKTDTQLTSAWKKLHLIVIKDIQIQAQRHFSPLLFQQGGSYKSRWRQMSSAHCCGVGRSGEGGDTTEPHKSLTKSNFHMIQQFHFWAFVLKSWTQGLKDVSKFTATLFIFDILHRQQ